MLCISVSCVPLFFSLVPLRVRCHSIVDLVLCLCDRIVLLGNSGDGLCWVEGRVVFTVYTPSVLWCTSQRCVCCDDSV